jgi:hypothetical protein
LVSGSNAGKKHYGPNKGAENLEAGFTSWWLIEVNYPF